MFLLAIPFLHMSDNQQQPCAPRQSSRWLASRFRGVGRSTPPSRAEKNGSLSPRGETRAVVDLVTALAEDPLPRPF